MTITPINPERQVRDSVAYIAEHAIGRLQSDLILKGGISTTKVCVTIEVSAHDVVHRDLSYTGSVGWSTEHRHARPLTISTRVDDQVTHLKALLDKTLAAVQAYANNPESTKARWEAELRTDVFWERVRLLIAAAPGPSTAIVDHHSLAAVQAELMRALDENAKLKARLDTLNSKEVRT